MLLAWLPWCGLALPTSGQEHELLELLLESLTLGVEARGGPEKWLRSRAWWEMSHVGNRPAQARSYYDITRQIAPKLICEIGLNGGHSAAIFLAAAGPSSRLVMFDTMAFSYSNWTVHALEQLRCQPRLALPACELKRRHEAAYARSHAVIGVHGIENVHRTVSVGGGVPDASGHGGSSGNASFSLQRSVPTHSP